MSRIGYAKIGRSWNLNPDKATSVGGDIDVINALIRLAKAHPEHEFVLVGKNSGEDPAVFGYPPNITNPWTQWKDNWTVAADPTRADEIIDHFRSISGNIHETLDHFIVWAGQHGSANSRIPMIGSNWVTPPGQEVIDFDVSRGYEYSNERNDTITGGDGENLATPQYAFIHYVSWLLDLLSRWREAAPGPEAREEIWLCPDPRNYLKCREKRWPIRLPVIAQYDFLRYHKGERFGRFPESLQRYDPTGYRENTLWVSNVAYCYGALELTAVGAPEDIAFDPTPGPKKFGMVMNENLTGVSNSRLQLLQSWIMPNFPDADLRGHWTEKSQLELNRVIEPVPYIEAAAVMKSFATTLTTPASGSGWATAKPWEAFALGSICFFHPRYDDQGWIIPVEANMDKEHWDDDARMLGSYLRVESAKQLAERVEEVTSNPDLYYAIVTAQRRHYEKSFARLEGGTIAIADRLASDLATENRPVKAIPVWCTRTEPPAAQVASRAAARPRGTNEERKKKPPVSRRRALRGGLNTPVTDDIAVEETVATEPVEASRLPETARAGFNFTAFNPASTLTLKLISKSEVRTSKDEYFLSMAEHVATRSTCARRSVGCVLVDQLGVPIAMGYNGVPRGAKHCRHGHPCPGADYPSGEGLGKCLSAHAEQNALMWCSDVTKIDTCYVTTSPCSSQCLKMLLNTSCQRIVFREKYADHEEAEALWKAHGRAWIWLPSTS